MGLGTSRSRLLSDGCLGFVDPSVGSLHGFFEDSLPYSLLRNNSIGLVHAPTDPHRPLAAVKRFFQLGTALHDPALDGRVVDRYPALLQEFFDMTIAQGIRHIPAYAHQDDILWEMGP